MKYGSCGIFRDFLYIHRYDKLSDITSSGHLLTLHWRVYMYVRVYK